MSTVTTTLEAATNWDEICFPVELVKVQSLFPADYELLATDRQIAIVGERQPGKKSVFGFQSNEYSLVPNSLIRSISDTCFGEHQVDVRYTHRGEFSINLILPDSLVVGKEKIFKTMIINNSYSGKTPFSLQGTVIRNMTETKARVSYFRQICSNGLMGWADDYLTMDEYLTWLANGKPKKHKDAKKMKTEIVEVKVEEIEVLVQKKISHKGLNIEQFTKYLTEAFKEFKNNNSDSLTAQVYQKLVATPAPSEILPVMVEAGLPKMLARTAIERLEKESIQLQTDANLWLVYNAMNYALFNSRSSLTIDERFRLDEAALHQVATLTL